MTRINVQSIESRPRKLRLLLAIACYGEKNVELLKRVIHGYQRMAMDVDVVVVSDAPKALDPSVRVVVGLPSKNPWSLPFAHKKVLADGVDRYDLFVYSEDDMEVTEANIQAFLRATAELAPAEIAGFLRYEVNESGTRSLPDAHGGYHWRPESVKRRGSYTIAEFTNEHAGFYILTQTQLKKAIQSGGFLRAPYEGRYGMLETAATDPYTSCGFRKVICISALEEFLIHHLSNRYAGQLGPPLLKFKQQVETQLAIANGTHPATTLCRTECDLLHGAWSKDYYEDPQAEVLSLIPETAREILSVGCGWGATEVRLKERGAAVTALPLDSIIGAEAERLGIEVTYGTLADCLRKMDGRTFDCVLVTNLLHLLPNPREVIEQCSLLVSPGGTFVIAGSNFGLLRVLANRALGRGDYRKLGVSDEHGIHVLGPGSVSRFLKESGLRVSVVRWFNQASGARIEGKLGRLRANNWIVQSQR